MKKVTYIIAVAAAMLTVACSKEEVKTPDSEEQGLVTYTFTAVYDDQVKSTLTTGGVFTWVEGDEIAIWNSTASAYVTFTVGEVTNGEATITGTASAGAVWGFAVYPASRAAGDGDAVDYTTTTAAGPILVSKVPTGQTLSFKYLGSVMNLQVNSVPSAEAPVTLSLTANADVFGVRSFTWADNVDTPTLGAISSGAQASVTVPFNTSGITTVPVPNVDLVGFTITVDNAAGRHLYKKTTASTAPLSTKILVNMPALDYVAPSTFYISTGSSRVSNTTQIPLIQTNASDDIFEVVMNSDCGVTYSVFDNYNIGNTNGTLLSGSTSAPAASASQWKVVGQVNGNGWTINNKLVAMQFIGNWHFVRNVTFDDTTPEFKFFENPSDWNANSYKGDGSSFSVGSEGTIVNGAGDPNITLNTLDNSKKYDIFVNFVTCKVIVKLSSDNYFPNMDGFFLFSYNRTDGVVSSNRVNELIDYPFNVSDPDMSTKMSIVGDFTSWNDQLMTYNNNHGWSTPITISTNGTYKFDFREKGTWGWYRWSDSRTQTSMFGYSGWQSANDDACKIDLTAGVYDVYVNAYSYYGNKAIKYCFVKR